MKAGFAYIHGRYARGPLPLKSFQDFTAIKVNTNVNFSGTNVAVELPSWLGSERLFADRIHSLEEA